jgi:nitrogenase delta subunit
MKEKIESLVEFIQERCLWQFHSRTWDREQTIEGVLARTGQILIGEEKPAKDPAEKCFHADAKLLVADFRTRFPWLSSLTKEELHTILDGVKARMRELAITGSRNAELNVENY